MPSFGRRSTDTDDANLPGPDQFRFVFGHDPFLEHVSAGGVDQMGDVGIQPHSPVVFPLRQTVGEPASALVAEVGPVMVMVRPWSKGWSTNQRWAPPFRQVSAAAYAVARLAHVPTVRHLAASGRRAERRTQPNDEHRGAG